jgi:hypothetical protein
MKPAITFQPRHSTFFSKGYNVGCVPKVGRAAQGISFSFWESLLLIRSWVYCTLLLWPLIHVYGSLPNRTSPNPSKENEDAVTNVSESTTHEEAQETEDTSKHVKFSSMVLISIVLRLATLCVALGNTIISTAVPRITHDLHSIDDVGWYAA